MQNDEEILNRRTFLKLGAASLAVAGSERLVPQALAEENGTRLAPARPVHLRSSALGVTLDGEDGLPFQYRLLRGGYALRERVQAMPSV
jgi:hypothetical protein